MNPQDFQDEKTVHGVPLRDYFAARAMQTLLGWDDDHANWRTYAEYAYQMADAMLEARKK